MISPAMPAITTHRDEEPDAEPQRRAAVKTKNPRSMPNCGSVSPKGSLLNASSTVRHCAEAATPAKKPTRTGAAIMTTRRSGSTASRYWSSVACSGVLGA